jgi:hypothetical protein
MIEKIRQWYLAIKTWLGVSEPGARKETVEDTLTEGVLKDLIERLVDHRENQSRRKRFPQVLIDGSKPPDRERAFAHGLAVPAWGKVSIDEWEGPAGTGCSLNFWVTETDASEWVLRLKWKPGTAGDNLGPLEWEEVVDENP